MSESEQNTSNKETLDHLDSSASMQVDDSYQDSEDDESLLMLVGDSEESGSDGGEYSADHGNDKDGTDENPDKESKSSSQVTTSLNKNTILSSRFHPKLQSYLNSSPRRIVRKYKRQAAARSLSLVKKVSEEPNVTVSVYDPLEIDGNHKINEKLGQFGTTVKKILVKNVVKPVLNPADDEIPEAVEATTVPEEPKPPLLPVKLVKPVRVESIMSRVPPRLPKVLLKKNAKGNFSLVGNTQSFPKAIIYPDYERKKQIEEQQPGTSAQKEFQGSVSNVKNSKTPKATLSYIESQHTSPKAGTSKEPTKPMEVEELFKILDDDDEMDDETPTEVEKPTNRLIVRRKTPAASDKLEQPEAIKYVIPQDMLMSANDRVKMVDESSNSSKTSEDTGTFANGELFFIDPNSSGDSSPQASNIEPFKVPPRPDTNLELIDTLAKYRVLVRNMLKKLDIEPIDFNAMDSDGYVDYYKIFRN